MRLSEVQFTYLGGIKTACLDRQQLVNLIVHSIGEYHGSSDSPLVIFDSNGHGISLANRDTAFMKIINQADIVHADGQSIVSMSKWFQGRNIPERSATTDMIHDIPKMAPQTVKHFLFGGSQNVVDKCASILSESYLNFEIAGMQNGYFDKSQNEEIISKINNSKADVLWVGLGKPKEQQWIIANRHKINVAVIITCGGCYNYVTGDYARAPIWMQNTGLEWLHRALTEPRKFLWRYLTTNPHCIYCLIKHKFMRGGNA